MKTTSLASTHRSERGIGSVELVLAIVLAFFCFSTGANWVKSQFESRWTEEKLLDLATEIVAVSEAASLAGLDLVDESGVRESLDLISTGATAGRGGFQGQFYSVPDLTEDVKIRVSDYLRIRYGKLEVISPKSAG